MSVGNRIQQARRAANLSQRELGEKLNVSGSMIGQYENDVRNPKNTTLQRIADVLEVDAVWLRTGKSSDDAGTTNAVVQAQKEILEYINLFCVPEKNLVEFIGMCQKFSNVLQQAENAPENTDHFAWIQALSVLADNIRNIYPESNGVSELIRDFRVWQEQRQNSKKLLAEYNRLSRGDQSKVEEYVSLLLLKQSS